MNPFTFYSRHNLSELTGIRVNGIEGLLENLKSVPGSSIYHHTHRFLQQHLYLSPEPPNDFAYWVSEILGDDELGEQLASIDIVQFNSIRAIRERLVEVIELYLSSKPETRKKFAVKGKEFYFIKSISFILPTKHTVKDLREFHEALSVISIDSIYFHTFEARLRLERGVNDFSFWVDTSLGERALAGEIAGIDPYTCTLEALRGQLLKIIAKRIK